MSDSRTSQDFQDFQTSKSDTSMSGSKCAKKPKIETVLEGKAIGVTDFRRLVKSRYFTDKTLMLKAIIELESPFPLITAPRRFGKTILLSMIRYFFEMRSDEYDRGGERIGDAEGERICDELFRPLKIGAPDYDYIREAMGKYPIIKLDFKCNSPILSYATAVGNLKTAIHKAYVEHEYLYNEDSGLKSYDRNLCRKWCNRETYYDNFSNERLNEHVVNLSKYLFQYYGKKCMLLVDEYDSICSHSVFEVDNNDLNHIIQSAMGILNALLKDDNQYVERAFLTGISQICSLGMSGANVQRIGFLRSLEFAPFYGFTKSELEALIRKDIIIGSYDGEIKDLQFFKDAEDCFNGYKSLFNPWDIVNYLSTKEKISYWCDTALVADLKMIFRLETFREDIEKLFSEEGVFEFKVITIVSLPDLQRLKMICTFEKYNASNLDVFYNFLYETGYLAPVSLNEDKMIAKIPNKKIKDRILYFMEDYFSAEWHLNFKDVNKCAELFDKVFIAFESEDNVDYKGNLRRICEIIEKILKNSHCKNLNESCLHSILFIIACKTSCKFLSNFKVGKEASDGSLDIALFNRIYCIIIEAKFNRRSYDGLKQIHDMQYYKIFNMKEFFPNNVQKYILQEITLDKNGNIFSNALMNTKDLENVCSIHQLP